MLIETFGVFISVFVSIYFLILCTVKKKKTTKEHVEPVRYIDRDSGLSNHGDVENAGSLRGSDTTSNSQQPNATLTNHNEEKRSHSQSQASQGRELPQPPTKEEASASQRNSMDRISRDSIEAVAAGENDTSKHHSPKGRRLPAPPPEDAQKMNAEDQGINGQTDEDPYASVDDDDNTSEKKKKKKKTLLGKLKVKTLDINEGSGDSTFYAKVADGPEEGEDDTDLYAQVDDKGIEVNGAKPLETVPESVPSTSKSVAAPPGAYAAPEYASIDKIKKGQSIKRNTPNPQTSNEPPAPPIPDRNFDTEDETNGAAAEEQEAQEQSVEANEKVPMYDKLCVRESLDHIRKREVVEKERRERYENLPCDGGESASDLYAQIEENNAEAVYESLSQPGSADGTYAQANNINPDYSSISELNESNDPPVNLQVRPQRQHHYEMIEHGASTS